MGKKELKMTLRDIDEVVKNFSKRMKSNWQIFFLVIIIIYCVSLYHILRVDPSLKLNFLEYAQNLDLISFIIAIGLALIIFNLKRKYFSKKFSRSIVELSLKSSPELSEIELLKTIFNHLQKKLYLIWFLGFLIVLDGVILYWIIYLSMNMHIYFIAGTFSLMLNYPRKVLFERIPWYIIDSKKELNQTTHNPT